MPVFHVNIALRNDGDVLYASSLLGERARNGHRHRHRQIGESRDEHDHQLATAYRKTKKGVCRKNMITLQ